ncbi:MAG: KH domain-containing protein [Clostridiales bacterium]|nr:KH domain-containing protein [Clostridiales bacterium]
MLKESVKEAATVEEAMAAIAQELAVPAERIQFEVLRQPQKKTLGLFGGVTAMVRGTYTVSPATKAADYLAGVLRHMGVQNPVIDIKEEEESCILTLSGEDMGFIIGRRGETLDALQYLTGLVSNRVDNSYYRVTLDIGNYREKREQTLTALARKVAGQAARSGRRTSLEPMNPYERRIIHTAVQDVEGAISWSVGSEPNRHVMIGPSDDNPMKDKPQSSETRGRSSQGRGHRGGKPSGGGRNGESRPPRGERPERAPRTDGASRSDVAPERPARQVRQFIPRSNPLPVADGATPPSKTPSEAESSASLYGRIDL